MKLRSSIIALASLTYACSDDAGHDDVIDQPAAGDAADAGTAEAGTAADATVSLDARTSIDAATEPANASQPYVLRPLLPDGGIDTSMLPYARGVQSYRSGANAGYGLSNYPDVVLGPPSGRGTNSGSTDVLSLGVGGEIVLDFGARTIVDGDGPDFIVFENPFYASGSSQASVFAELGEVSVSNDLTTWTTFHCTKDPPSPGVYPGCAGWLPTLMYDPFVVVPLDPNKTGGNTFDLKDIAVTSARYVRVLDLATSGQGTSAGFDLDAIGVINSDQ